MDKKIILLCLLCFGFSFSLVAQNSILGKWKSIDDETGKPRSYVEIYENGKGVLEGKILKVIPGPGDEADPICDECSKSDPRHGQPVNGMVIITKMKIASNKKSAKSGKILDPESGNVYGCILTLNEDGKSLKVRGYLGIKALGRTQIWQRAE